MNPVSETEHFSTMAAEASNSSAKKGSKRDGHPSEAKLNVGNESVKKDKGKDKAKINMVDFLAKLSGVKENILKLKETSLFGFVIGDSMDIAKIRPKLRND